MGPMRRVTIVTALLRVAQFKHFASTFGPLAELPEKVRADSMCTMRLPADAWCRCMPQAARSLMVEQAFDVGSAWVVQPWYHGTLGRTDAAAKVAALGEAAFLVRASSRAGSLAVQFVTGGSTKNCLLFNVGKVRFLMPRLALSRGALVTRVVSSWGSPCTDHHLLARPTRQLPISFTLPSPRGSLRRRCVPMQCSGGAAAGC